MLTRAVSRGCERALVIGDLPFMRYQVSDEDAVRNAGRFVKDAGADAVKLEGARDVARRASAAIVDAGIPVMGHLGLTPQTATMLGGYKVQGRAAGTPPSGCTTTRSRSRRPAASRIVLECVPDAVSPAITEAAHDPDDRHRRRRRHATARCSCSTTCSTCTARTRSSPSS